MELFNKFKKFFYFWVDFKDSFLNINKSMGDDSNYPESNYIKELIAEKILELKEEKEINDDIYNEDIETLNPFDDVEPIFNSEEEN